MPKNTSLPLLVIATHNAHKTGEFRALLGDRWHVEDLTSHAELTPPEETGSTFLENATIKALSAARFLGPDVLVVADDSGLEVDALGLAPGVYSSRFAGPDASDAENRAKLLSELSAAKSRNDPRSARFHCVLAVARGGKIAAHFQGTVEGRIALKESGAGGFGYDALFIPDGHALTFGGLPAALKNTISHRARALEKFVRWLNSSQE